MTPELYRRGRAPIEGTQIAIGYLREYVKQFPNRRRAVVDLLGCHASTAKRLLSRSKPYSARIRVEWVHNICAAVGKPPGRVLGKKGVRLFPQAVLGWAHAKSNVEALELASDCATSIAVRASVHYGLTGHFSISYQHGVVSEVVIYLAANPDLTIEGGKNGYHRIVIVAHKDHDGVRRMWVQHIDPVTGGATDKETLDPQRLESIIYYIYALNPNNSTNIVRELLRKPPAKRRRLDKRRSN